MDLTYPAETETYRHTVQAFLDQNLPDDWQGYGALAPAERHEWHTRWREILAANKLLAPTWPTEFGGAGLTHLEYVALAEEFAKRGVPTSGPNDAFSITMVGNTILQWGTDEQKAYYIPRILDGTDLWCQGYSEPDAGSDLAGLGCKAELDGDEWIINGQKIWTSAGQHANMIFTLCRTDPDVVKHAGISFLLVPMDQPGVEVRPIINVAGDSHFNEVFYSDARAPKGNVLGGINNGWAVANTLLGFERGAGATVQPLGFRAELDAAIDVMKERGLTSDPLVRQKLADHHIKTEIMRFRGMQALTRFLSGKGPGPESSIGKLFWSEYHSEMTNDIVNMLGPEALVNWGEGTRGGLGSAPAGTPATPANMVSSALIARSGTIYAGTSQVQRNIIGERVLGLPKEPRADKGSWKESVSKS